MDTLSSALTTTTTTTTQYHELKQNPHQETNALDSNGDP